jgi:hypothetical protein
MDNKIFQPVLLATYTEDNMTAELTQLDAEGTLFSTDVFSVHAEGEVRWHNNSGSVQGFDYALGLFELDLDCFFWGVEFADSMKTEKFPVNA